MNSELLAMSEGMQLLVAAMGGVVLALFILWLPTTQPVFNATKWCMRKLGMKVDVEDYLREDELPPKK